MNFRFPVFLDISGKDCLVAGEGFEIPAKVQMLVDAAANVTYIHPAADPKIKALANAGLIRWEQRDFQLDDLRNRFLVITDRDDNADIFRMAEQNRTLCNSVDDPENCRFSFGSVHRQGELSIAISTNGSAPALAVRIKEWLRREIGPEYAKLIALLKSIRPEITSRISDFAARRELWYRIVDSNALRLLRAAKPAEAEAQIRSLIEEAVNSISRSDISGDGGSH